MGARTWTICSPQYDAVLTSGGDFTAVSSVNQPKLRNYLQTAIHDDIKVMSFPEWKGPASIPPPSYSRTSEVEPPKIRADKPASTHPCQLNDIKFFEICLRSGDALFLPAKWWHLVSASPPHSAAINWYFEPNLKAEDHSNVQPVENKQTLSSWGGDVSSKSPQPSSSLDSLGGSRDNPLVEIVLGGNLLEAPEPYIVHQCNCFSKGARGVAKLLFSRYFDADS
jgi:hypothetical protein